MKITSIEPGTPSAWTSFMRTILALVLLSGCFSVGSAWVRPGVMPVISELPADKTKRDAIIDSSTVVGPEQRKGMTVKERKVETAASTAAAIIGGIFSKTETASLSAAIEFDENTLAPLPVPPPHPGSADDPANPPVPVDGSDKDLTPWIKLR